jgi:hypothetical protein
MRILKLLPCLFVVASLLPVCALADFELSGQLAGGFPTNGLDNVTSPSLLAGAQLTFGALGLEYGFAYEHTFLSFKNNGGTDSLDFYGGVIRLGTFTGLFADAQAGVCEYTGTGTSFSWGVGAGYAIPMSPFIDFSPRVGYRAVPSDGFSRSMVDAGVLITLKIL